MWIAYKPPQMLPTKTLNPTVSATGAVKPTDTGKSKRSLEGGDTSEEHIEWGIPKRIVSQRPLEDTLWWIAAIGIVLSSLLYIKSWSL